MPLIIGEPGAQHYWSPEIYGTHIDILNRTHDLSFCENTLEGKICKVQSSVYEPCLLQNTVNV